MINELKALKERIVRGETTISDVDTVNHVIEYVKKMEVTISAITEIPGQSELIEPSEGNIYITAENLTINYFGPEEQSPHPKQG